MQATADQREVAARQARAPAARRARRCAPRRRAAPRAGSACLAAAVGTSKAGIASTPSRPAGGSSAHGSASGADHEAAQQRRRDVVGMALELAPRARTAARRARTCGRPRTGPATIAAALEPSPAAGGISERIVKRMPSAGWRRSNALHAEVVAVARHARHVALDGELAGLLHLELQLDRQRRGQHVVARPEVGRRGRHAHHSAPVHPSTARSTLSMSGSQGTTGAARFIAVCGSLSPWPVSTQTTRPSAP